MSAPCSPLADEESVLVDEDDVQEDDIMAQDIPPSEDSKQPSAKGREFNRFPLTRIRTLMKLDPDVTISSAESVFIITKAAELFVQLQAQEAYKRTQLSKRKTVQKKDLDATIAELDCMAFLEGAID